jgi:hypothetical protein
MSLRLEVRSIRSNDTDVVEVTRPETLDSDCSDRTR